jgi:hypothetical protein
MPRIVNVARSLMIDPGDVERSLRRELKGTIAAGEVLARSGRLGGRICTAPVSGIISAIDNETGYVTISPDPTSFELTANLRGVVMEVFGQEGVRIETPATQVFGAFGVGGEAVGVLRLGVTDPSEMLTDDKIDARSAYAIVIGGSGITASALRSAVKGNVRGIIVGGIDEDELRTFLEVESLDCWKFGQHGWQIGLNQVGTEPPLTIVVTEGFGIRPMSEPLFETIAAHDRQEALIDSTTILRGKHRRPRIIIPLSSRSTSIQLEAQPIALAPGTQVRLLDSAHLGQIGRVRSLTYTPRPLASRVRTATVDLVLDNGSVLTLPQTAVETLP